MRRLLGLIFLAALCACFVPRAAAAEAEPSYAEVWSALDGRTQGMLEELGLNGADAASALSLSPQGLLNAVKNAFSAELSDVLETVGLAAALLLTVSACLSFCPAGKTRELAEVIGSAALVFLLTARISRLVSACAGAIEAGGVFIKALLPAFCAAVSFSGDPTAALSAQGVLLVFAETVSAFFAEALPFAAVLCVGLGAAEAVRPGGLCGRAAKRLQTLAVSAAGLAAGVFTAALGAKRVIAGAVDSAAGKGLKFLIGGGIPVVGSALSDALGAVLGSLAVLRAGLGVLGVLALAAIHLFPLCALVQWRIGLALLDVFAGGFGNRRVSGFLQALSAMASMLTAVLCFHAAVYIVSLGLLMTVRE